MEKSKGQTVVERLAAWIGGYMFFADPAVALVAALWAINTWVFERFDAVPYLCVTAATKQAGKTRLMELLRMLSQGGRMFGDMTPAAMFRLMEAYDQRITIFFDEAEKLSSSAAGVMRSVMNTGYRRGQVVTRGKAGGGVEEFPVFGPKCFALIGDVNPTLRDRSIVVTLERGKPAKDFQWATAEGEAAKLVEDLKEAFRGVGGVYAGDVDFLQGRDREIWAPLFGVASALGLDKATMGVLTRVAADLTAAKTAPARRHVDLGADEETATDDSYGERALRDLASILRESEPAVFSAVAVERLKAIPAGPWRTFRGLGLTEVVLAQLVSRFGLQTRCVRMEKGRKAKCLRGYSAKDIRATAKGV